MADWSALLLISITKYTNKALFGLNLFKLLLDLLKKCRLPNLSADSHQFPMKINTWLIIR